MLFLQKDEILIQHNSNVNLNKRDTSVGDDVRINIGGENNNYGHTEENNVERSILETRLSAITPQYDQTMKQNYEAINPTFKIYQKQSEPKTSNSTRNKNSRAPKRLINSKMNAQPLPMKVTDLNMMVQIRKKKPRMKFNEKMVYREQKERQIFSQQIQTRAQVKKQ